MRRFLTWLGLGAGALAVWRWRLRRRKPAPPVDDPAEELKRRLADSRTDESAAAPEPEVEEPQPTLDERRRDARGVRERRELGGAVSGEPGVSPMSRDEDISTLLDAYDAQLRAHVHDRLRLPDSISYEWDGPILRWTGFGDRGMVGYRDLD